MTKEQVRILVVDDERIVQGFLQRILEEARYDVITADNGQEALDKLAQFDVSLVLLDIKMPELDGLQVLERVRKISNVPVIMLTVVKEEAAVLATLSIGADDYVPKPFDHEVLLARIQAKLKRNATGL